MEDDHADPYKGMDDRAKEDIADDDGAKDDSTKDGNKEVITLGNEANKDDNTPNTENKILLVYPFDMKLNSFRTISSGLTELNWNRLGIDEVEANEYETDIRSSA